MKVSAKLDYACRILVRLAIRYDAGRLSSMEELAEIEEVPRQFLGQIMADLRRGGLVTSRRGKRGGYCLARPPEEVTVLDAMALAQGDLLASAANAGGASGERVGLAWLRLRRRLEEEAAAIDFRGLAQGGEERMYYI